MRDFAAAAAGLVFAARDKGAKYAFVEKVLKQQGYLGLGKKDRGAVRAWLEKVTGLSPAQLSRLIRRFGQEGAVRLREAKRPRFARVYGREDLRLLAEADEVHEGLSGPAMKRVLVREYQTYGRAAYRRLAGISVSHLYNLRRRAEYREMSGLRQKTRPVRVGIAARRPPEPRHRPGFLRVDTVHQGDAPDGRKGVCHINTVDSVTQWEVAGAVEALSEAY